MFPDCTPAVTRAWEAALEAATRHGRPEPSATDLSLALLADDEARPAQMLRQAGVEPDAARAALEGRRGDSGPATAAAEAARELTRDHTGGLTVASEFLMRALVREDARLGWLLAGLGLTTDGLEQVESEYAAPPLTTDEP